MPTIIEQLKQTEKVFSENNIEEPQLTTRLLLSHILQIPHLELSFHYQKELSTKQMDLFGNLVKRKLQREPIQYITNKAYFMNLKLKATPAVLIPRPETEQLVLQVKKYFFKTKNIKATIVDIGTGSGCIAISLSRFLPNKIIATEISKEAITIARENIQTYNANVKILPGNILEPLYNLSNETNEFFIVANPPYISSKDLKILSPEISNYEPKIALYGGEDGLIFYRKILEQSQKLKKVIGFAFEVGKGQAQAVKKMIQINYPKNNTKIIKDLSNIDRIVISYALM